jgi:blue copper oxidase
MKRILIIVLAINMMANKSEAQNRLAIPDTLTGKIFNLNIYDTSTAFYNGFTTKTFGVNTNYLGPTLLVNQGDSVSMIVNNHLMDTTTIHWHGLHVSAVNDGGPHTVIPPNTVWNPRFKIRDHAAMYWYHPHLHMMTNLHATLGAAGVIIVRDSIEKKLDLPRRYGVDDFPLVIQSKCFDGNKQIVIDNAYDSVMMVNGTLDAYLPTPAQVVRFRLLNASSERVYNIGFQGNLTFYQIGTDGGLLNAPVSLTRLRLAPGERADILVNFTEKNGQNIQLMSFASEFPNAIYGALQPGMGAGQTIPGYTSNALNGKDFTLMTFNIVNQTINAVTTIPANLVTNSVWPITSANATKTLTFMPVNMGQTAIRGPFMINNAHFDMDVINYSIPLNNVEIWSLTNQSPIAHPFHIHDVQFYITEINGAAPPANMAGRKDVVLVQAQQTIKFITKFETFCDSMATYMYHCHMMTHEDGGMMGQFKVTCPDGTSITEIINNTNEIVVFPNPASKIVTIKQHSNSEIFEVKLMDYAGKTLIIKSTINSNEITIDTENLPSGLYNISIKNIEGIYYKKVNIIK